MGSSPKVRRGTEEDAEVLAGLLKRFNAEYEEEPVDVDLTVERIRDLMATGEGVFFLAGEGAGPLGFAYLQFNPSLYSRKRDAYLGELYVVPDRRGEGFGRAMLEAVLEEGGHPDPGPASRAVADLLEGALVHAVAVRSRRVDDKELTRAVERLLR